MPQCKSCACQLPEQGYCLSCGDKIQQEIVALKLKLYNIKMEHDRDRQVLKRLGMETAPYVGR